MFVNMQQMLYLSIPEYLLWIKIEKAYIVFFFEILIAGSPASREYRCMVVVL